MKFWEEIRIYEGSIFQFNYPTLCIPVDTHDQDADLAGIQDIEAALKPKLTKFALTEFEKILIGSDHLLAAHINALILALQSLGEQPIRSMGKKIVSMDTRNVPGVAAKQLLFRETIDPQYIIACIELLRQFHEKGLAKLDKQIERLAARSSWVKEPRTNPRLFLGALQRLNIPVSVLPGNILLCGWGEKSRFLNSSSTEMTGATPMDLTRDKAVASQFMKHCNLPVSEQRIVSSSEEALQAARDLGFPVAIKPRSRDGGVGVTRAVSDEAAVKQAFTRARSKDSSVIVERHAQGKEYRLLFANGHLVSIHERIPAEIIGDGRRAVFRLVEDENKRRKAALYAGFRNFQIAMNEDANLCLAAQGMTARSVPAEGVVVRLATVPKVQTGGDVRLIQSSSVHCDVLDAAARAVDMFRLDVAGVDYITTDISGSPGETGGIITEVNALPQINTFDEFDIYETFLTTLLADVGRIPSILATATVEADVVLLENVISQLQSNGLRIGLLTADDTAFARSFMDVGVRASFANRMGVIADRSVNCIIAIQDPADMGRRGLLLSHFDAVVLPRNNAHSVLRAICGPLLEQNIRGPILVAMGSLKPEELDRSQRSSGYVTYKDAGQCANLLLSLMEQQG